MFVLMKAGKFDCALEKMAPEAVGRAAEILRMLAHPVRLRIIDALHTAGELPVGQITVYLGIGQAATSQHLNQLRRLGLLKADRRGKEMWYYISDNRPVARLDCICKCCKNSE